MNNEPVAYINVEERRLQWAGPVKWDTPTIAKMDKIPLYTHPVKELTDEEILEIASPMFEDARYPSTALDFAEAILRKAQEK
jgi:hypothetical protein